MTPLPTTERATALEVLRTVRTIAVVGASARADRPSHQVMATLIAHGYTVWGVNPGLAGQTLLARPVVPTLADLPAPLDMVDVFRRSEQIPEVVDSALNHNVKVIWLQLSLYHEAAVARARAAGITVVVNRCPARDLLPPDP